jgi:hypothetical protein
MELNSGISEGDAQGSNGHCADTQEDGIVMGYFASYDEILKVLHPELKKCLVEEEAGLMLKTPFTMAGPGLSIRRAKEAEQHHFVMKGIAEQHRKNCNWGGYIFAHEKYHRLLAFLKIEHYLKSPEYWSLLGEIWADIDNLWQYRTILPNLLRSKRRGRKHFMTDEEREAFRRLPSRLDVYRAYRDGVNYYGPSWTLDSAYAERLAGSLRRDSVRQRTMRKSQVFAYLTRRDESEVILLDELEEALSNGQNG